IGVRRLLVEEGADPLLQESAGIPGIRGIAAIEEELAVGQEEDGFDGRHGSFSRAFEDSSRRAGLPSCPRKGLLHVALVWQNTRMIGSETERQVRHRLEAMAASLAGPGLPEPARVRELLAELDRGLGEIGEVARVRPHLA